MKNVLLLLALIACNKTNPNYCADHPDHNCNEAIDAPIDTPVTNCATAGCSGGNVCDTATNMCVQCTAALTNNCSGTAPVCDSTDTCRPCGADAECSESGACMSNGSCALSSTVLYASTTGGATTCTHADMCSLAHALTLVDTTYTIIHLEPGTYAIDGITTTANLTITGRGATIDRGGGTIGPVFTVGGGLSATLEFVTLTGGHSSAAANGITCGSGQINLHQVTIQTNSGIGIGSTSCDVVAERAMIFANSEGGIYLGGTTTTKFDITDTFVIRNGNNIDAMFGGIYILPQTVGTSRLEFNTIVDNQASSGVTHFGGVTCDIAAVGAANNIVARNLKGASATGQQTQGQCGFLTSKVQDDVAGLNFIQSESQPYNYGLTVTSSAIDQATTASAVDVDFVGKHRPQGTQKDIGADEYKP